MPKITTTTPEDREEQKRKSKNRVFWLLISVDALIFAYIIYQIVILITK